MSLILLCGDVCELVSFGEAACLKTPRRRDDKMKLKTTIGTTITKNANEINDDKVIVS